MTNALGPRQQVVGDDAPVGELRRAEVNEFTAESVGAVLVVPVIDEEVAAVEVLVVRQDQSLMRRRGLVQPEVEMYPLDLVLPGRRVIPGSRRQNVGVESLR